MTRSEASAVVSDLSSASDASTVLVTLREIKNQIVGHGERKQKWVRAGLGYYLACLVAPLEPANLPPPQNGKGTYQDSRGDHGEEARVEALAILASLAQCKSPKAPAAFF